MREDEYEMGPEEPPWKPCSRYEPHSQHQWVDANGGYVICYGEGLDALEEPE